MISIFYDGSYRQKKGGDLAWGFLAVEDGKVLHWESGRISGPGDSMKSEYTALRMAIHWALKDLMPVPVGFLGDNASLSSLMNRSAKPRKTRHKSNILGLRLIVTGCDQWFFRWIPRENNIAHFVAASGRSAPEWKTPLESIARWLDK